MHKWAIATCALALIACDKKDPEPEPNQVSAPPVQQEQEQPQTPREYMTMERHDRALQYCKEHNMDLETWFYSDDKRMTPDVKCTPAGGTGYVDIPEEIFKGGR